MFGQIRMQFLTDQNELVAVIRGASLSERGKKAEFKRLDNEVIVSDSTGTNVKKIYNNCKDTDRLVPELLNCPSAVLENVIFCHQEEFNWPFQDSAKLKKVFDEIFDTTKYSKKVTALREVKKKLIQKNKNNLFYCQKLHKEYTNYSKLLVKQSNCEHKKNSLLLEIEAIETDLSEMSARKEELKLQTSEKSDLECNLIRLKTERKNIEQRMSSIRHQGGFVDYSGNPSRMAELRSLVTDRDTRGEMDNVQLVVRQIENTLELRKKEKQEKEYWIMVLEKDLAQDAEKQASVAEKIQELVGNSQVGDLKSELKELREKTVKVIESLKQNENNLKLAIKEVDVCVNYKKVERDKRNQSKQKIDSAIRELKRALEGLNDKDNFEKLRENIKELEIEVTKLELNEIPTTQQKIEEMRKCVEEMYVPFGHWNLGELTKIASTIRNHLDLQGFSGPDNHKNVEDLNEKFKKLNDELNQIDKEQQLRSQNIKLKNAEMRLLSNKHEELNKRINQKMSEFEEIKAETESMAIDIGVDSFDFDTFEGKCQKEIIEQIKFEERGYFTEFLCKLALMRNQCVLCSNENINFENLRQMNNIIQNKIAEDMAKLSFKCTKTENVFEVSAKCRKLKLLQEEVMQIDQEANEIQNLIDLKQTEVKKEEELINDTEYEKMALNGEVDSLRKLNVDFHNYEAIFGTKVRTLLEAEALVNRIELSINNSKLKATVENEIRETVSFSRELSKQLETLKSKLINLNREKERIISLNDVTTVTQIKEAEEQLNKKVSEENALEQEITALIEKKQSLLVMQTSYNITKDGKLAKYNDRLASIEETLFKLVNLLSSEVKVQMEFQIKEYKVALVSTEHDIAKLTEDYTFNLNKLNSLRTAQNNNAHYQHLLCDNDELISLNLQLEHIVNQHETLDTRLFALHPITSKRLNSATGESRDGNECKV